MIVRAIVIGDNNKINLKFDKGLKGFGFGSFKKNDNLLELSILDNQIITKWDKFTPRLSEKFKNDTICFMKNK
jgi:hypothetical protein